MSTLFSTIYKDNKSTIITCVVCWYSDKICLLAYFHQTSFYRKTLHRADKCSIDVLMCIDVSQYRCVCNRIFSKEKYFYRIQKYSFFSNKRQKCAFLKDEDIKRITTNRINVQDIVFYFKSIMSLAQDYHVSLKLSFQFKNNIWFNLTIIISSMFPYQKRSNRWLTTKNI